MPNRHSTPDRHRHVVKQAHPRPAARDERCDGDNATMPDVRSVHPIAAQRLPDPNRL